MWVNNYGEKCCYGDVKPTCLLHHPHRKRARAWRTELLKEIERAFIHYGLEVCLCWSAKEPCNLLELVTRVRALEERLTHEQLANDASNRPHVDGRSIRDVEAKQFGCTIPGVAVEGTRQCK